MNDNEPDCYIVVVINRSSVDEFVGPFYDYGKARYAEKAAKREHKFAFVVKLTSALKSSHSDQRLRRQGRGLNEDAACPNTVRGWDGC